MHIYIYMYIEQLERGRLPLSPLANEGHEVALSHLHYVMLYYTILYYTILHYTISY